MQTKITDAVLSLQLTNFIGVKFEMEHYQSDILSRQHIVHLDLTERPGLNVNLLRQIRLSFPHIIWCNMYIPLHAMKP